VVLRQGVLVDENMLSKKAQVAWTAIIIGAAVVSVTLLICALIFYWNLSNAGS